MRGHRKTCVSCRVQKDAKCCPFIKVHKGVRDASSLVKKNVRIVPDISQSFWASVAQVKCAINFSHRGLKRELQSTQSIETCEHTTHWAALPRPTCQRFLCGGEVHVTPRSVPRTGPPASVVSREGFHLIRTSWFCLLQGTVSAHSHVLVSSHGCLREEKGYRPSCTSWTSALLWSWKTDSVCPSRPNLASSHSSPTMGRRERQEEGDTILRHLPPKPVLPLCLRRDDFIPLHLSDAFATLRLRASQ